LEIIEIKAKGETQIYFIFGIFGILYIWDGLNTFQSLKMFDQPSAFSQSGVGIILESYGIMDDMILKALSDKTNAFHIDLDLIAPSHSVAERHKINCNTRGPLCCQSKQRLQK